MVMRVGSGSSFSGRTSQTTMVWQQAHWRRKCPKLPCSGDLDEVGNVRGIHPWMNRALRAPRARLTEGEWPALPDCGDACQAEQAGRWPST